MPMYDSLDKSDFCCSFTKEKEKLGHSINFQFRFLYFTKFRFVDDANEAFPHWSTRLIPILRSWPQKPLSSNWRASSLCFHCIFAIQRFLITSHHFRFCVRRNGSWLVNNHRCPSCDKWSPDCLTNSAHTQTSRFMWKHDPRNTLSVMVTLIPGSFLLWNFYNLPLPNWIDAGEAILSSSSLGGSVMSSHSARTDAWSIKQRTMRICL